MGADPFPLPPPPAPLSALGLDDLRRPALVRAVAPPEPEGAHEDAEGAHVPGVSAFGPGEHLREQSADDRTGHRGRAVLVNLADVVAARTRWLWPGRIPYGKVTLLDGDPKLGKSTLTAWLAAAVSTGSPLPGGSRLDGPAGVVLMSAEDAADDTIKPRLLAAGADCSRIVLFEAVAEPGAPDDRLPSLPGDTDALAEAVAVVGAGLVVVDPLMAYLGEAVNSYRDQDVRRALHPLKVLAEDTGRPWWWCGI